MSTIFGGHRPPFQSNGAHACNSALMGGGITAKVLIKLSGGAFLDSYDSSDGPYSAATAKSNAVALTDSTNSGAISLSGGYIAGVAATGPGGTITLTGSATIKGST